MDNFERLKLRTDEENEDILSDCLETAKNAILSRRFPLQNWPTDDDGNPTLEAQYTDLQFLIALDLYNKQGAEGELSHSENGISRSYESSWISEQLLAQVIPYCGVPE